MQNVATGRSHRIGNGHPGGVIGYFIARLLVERLAIVGGQQAFLLVILPSGLTALSANRPYDTQAMV
jgi:hypothetical protein